MSPKMLRPFIVKVSVVGYFHLSIIKYRIVSIHWCIDIAFHIILQSPIIFRL